MATVYQSKAEYVTLPFVVIKISCYGRAQLSLAYIKNVKELKNLQLHTETATLFNPWWHAS